MFDVGMLIFALLALAWPFALQSVPGGAVLRHGLLAHLRRDGVRRRRRVLATSVTVYVAPSLFLAVFIDRVVAVVRRLNWASTKAPRGAARRVPHSPPPASPA